MLQGFGSEAQIQLLEAHVQAGNHRRDVCEIGEVTFCTCSQKVANVR